MDLDEVDCILFLNTRVPDLQFYLFIVINMLLFVLFLEATNKSVCHSFFCIIIGLTVVFFSPQELHT